MHVYLGYNSLLYLFVCLFIVAQTIPSRLSKILSVDTFPLTWLYKFVFLLFCILALA